MARGVEVGPGDGVGFVVANEGETDGDCCCVLVAEAGAPDEGTTDVVGVPVVEMPGDVLQPVRRIATDASAVARQTPSVLGLVMIAPGSDLL